VLQADAFNRSRLATVVVASLTTQLKYATAPGNVTCRPRGTGLPAVSVINVSQISAVDKGFLGERIGQLPSHLTRDVEEGVKLVLGL
jgi:mRNA interferase MazF